MWRVTVHSVSMRVYDEYMMSMLMMMMMCVLFFIISYQYYYYALCIAHSQPPTAFDRPQATLIITDTPSIKGKCEGG